MTFPNNDGHTYPTNKKIFFKLIMDSQAIFFACFYIAQRPTDPDSVYPSPGLADDQKRQKRKTKNYPQ